MPTNRPTLLPPNATAAEHALEATGARVSDVPAPLLELWDPATCPVELLPWLAWGLSIDSWEVDWPEQRKRDAVAVAIELQRRKGTPASVDAVLAAFDELLELVEWWETSPRGTPHTFDVILPLDGAGGTRATAAFANAIIREVARVKPARSHMRMVQAIAAAGQIGLIGAARFTAFRRDDATIGADTSQPWGTFLLTEDGEPIEAPEGPFLEDVG